MAIELKPIPTRIFGIGMHKTATTSLHEALKILGFDSFHWGKGEAPLIWQEMISLGRSKTLEQWYALSDLPIPLLYKELDKAYPGSKFILTVRDENDWLKSVERLWSYERNATRKLWDIYPFSNHIHTVLYGTKDFNAAVFLERYRRHNREVKEYFKDRPLDLLVFDIPAAGWYRWNELCWFLGVPVPDVPFPWGNRTEKTLVCAFTGEEYGPAQATQASPSPPPQATRGEEHADQTKTKEQEVGEVAAGIDAPRPGEIDAAVGPSVGFAHDGSVHDHDPRGARRSGDQEGPVAARQGYDGLVAKLWDWLVICSAVFCILFAAAALGFFSFDLLHAAFTHRWWHW